jgi:putative two-component system response regulator
MNNKYTILVVDDIEENIKIVVNMLDSAGYQTKIARDGLTALRISKEEDFDLILMDIMMPIMGGLETCRYLKVEPKTASIPVIFITASDDKNTLTKAYNVGGSDYIRKPFFKEELLARIESRLKLRDYEKNLEYKVQERTKDIYATQVQLMITLGGIAEGHSPETYLHVRRVAEFTYRLAILYGMPQEEALQLKDASSLHDIGKLGVRESVLHKNTALDKKEYKEIQEHASIGAGMLQHSELPLFKIATIVCMQHHEKYNGTGYPKKLKGEEIHIYGRIVAIADVFDALLFRRAYKHGWSESEVLSFMKEMRGVHFDPQLIDIFFENIDDFLSIYNSNIKKIELEQGIAKGLNKTKMEIIKGWLLQEI